MNAFLAGLFVTSAWIGLAASSDKARTMGNSSKIGLVVYALGTFVWSLKGLEIGSPALMCISAIQTLAVMICVVML